MHHTKQQYPGLLGSGVRRVPVSDVEGKELRDSLVPWVMPIYCFLPTNIYEDGSRNIVLLG